MHPQQMNGKCRIGAFICLMTLSCSSILEKKCRKIHIYIKHYTNGSTCPFTGYYLLLRVGGIRAGGIKAPNDHHGGNVQTHSETVVA